MKMSSTDHDNQTSIRTKLVTDILTDIARRDATANLQDIVREITLWDILNASRRPGGSETDGTQNSDGWVGLLPENDTIRFGLSSRPELHNSVQRQLEEELDNLILSISDYFHADADQSHLNEEDRMRAAWSVPRDLRLYKETIATTRADLDAACLRIENLVTSTNKTHSRLLEELLEVLSKFPEEINNRRNASNDLLATTIETSLIKLSLMRTKAHQALYDYKSPTNPDTNMSKALSNAYAKLKADERKMEGEERHLDRQLEEYATMLQLVDGGGGGGFAQVIEDWTTVQREREECKRDLRRLGWTEN